MKTIPLIGGGEAMVSDCDYEKLSVRKWRVRRQSPTLAYAVSGKLWMHHVVLGREPGKLVDHRDGNGLNNQRENLRQATRQQNIWNTKNNSRRRSEYKGVCYGPAGYFARLTANHISYASASFPTQEEAARAYNWMATQFYGEFARCNAVERPLCQKVEYTIVGVRQARTRPQRIPDAVKVAVFIPIRKVWRPSRTRTSWGKYLNALYQAQTLAEAQKHRRVIKVEFVASWQRYGEKCGGRLVEVEFAQREPEPC